LNPPDREIDREWAVVAKSRLDDLRSGRVRAIPGDEVFAKIGLHCLDMNFAFHPESEDEST